MSPYQKFLDHLLRDVADGMGVPYELIYSEYKPMTIQRNIGTQLVCGICDTTLPIENLPEGVNRVRFRQKSGKPVHVVFRYKNSVSSWVITRVQDAYRLAVCVGSNATTERDLDSYPSLALSRAERQLQIERKGYTALHDDLHVDGSIGRAAACYAATAAAQIKYNTEGQPLPACYVHRDWPWERESFKPSPDPLHNLVKAGAMIAAEIDRIERSRKEQRHESA